jgi:hypothetical protein
MQNQSLRKVGVVVVHRPKLHSLRLHLAHKVEETIVQAASQKFFLNMSDDSDHSDAMEGDIIDDEFAEEDGAAMTPKGDGFADMMSKILKQKVGDKVSYHWKFLNLFLI